MHRFGTCKFVTTAYIDIFVADRRHQQAAAATDMAAALELSISQKLFENPIIVTDQPMAPNNILPGLQLSFGASKTKNRQGHSFPFVPFKFGKENVLYSSNLVPLSQDMIPNHV